MPHRKNFARNSLYSVLGFAVLVSANFGFNAFAARSLGVNLWGVFNSFFYILIAFTQPLNSLQLAVARYSTDNRLHGQAMLSRLLPTLLLFSLIIVGLFSLPAWFIRNLYNLPHLGHAVLGGVVLALWISLAGIRGIYQGAMDFKKYGLSLGSEGLLRLGFGVILVLLGGRVGGALGASLFSGFFSVLVLVLPWLRDLDLRGLRLQLDRELLKDFFTALLILLPFGLIMSMDTTLVQYVIGGEQAGYINACALFGKNLIVLSMVLANVVFSYTLKHDNSTLWWGIVLSSFAFIVAAVAMFPLGEWILGTLLGRDFIPAAGYLPLYITATLPLGIMQHLLNYSIARDIRAVPVLLWAVLLPVAAVYVILLRRASLDVFLWSVLLIMSALDGVLLLLIRHNHKNALKPID